MARKVFDVKTMKEATCESKFIITAGGAIIYKIVKGELYLLLQSYSHPDWPLLDDFGGKADLNDNTIFDTIIRETKEESNDKIDITLDIKNRNYKSFYNKFSKYFCILIQKTPVYKSNTDIFGDKEIKDNIDRVVKWYKYIDVSEKLGQRLFQCKALMRYLEDECKRAAAAVITMSL